MSHIISFLFIAATFWPTFAFSEQILIQPARQQSVGIDVGTNPFHPAKNLMAPMALKNSNDVCEIHGGDEGQTEYFGAAKVTDDYGNEKIVQLLSVRFVSGCRFYFGRVKNAGEGSTADFFLLGDTIVSDGEIAVSYTRFGATPTDIMGQLLELIKGFGLALPPNHLPVRLLSTAP